MTNTYHHGDLKESVLTLAIDYIKREGHANFSLRELATSLGVSHVSLYRHFKNKDMLINAIVARSFESFHHALTSAPVHKKVDKHLLNVGRAYVQFAIDEEGQYRSMFYRYSSELQEGSCEYADKAFLFLIELIEKGISEKVFKKVDPQMAGRHFWSGLHGLALLIIDGQFYQTGEKEIEEQVEFSLKLILQSITL